MFYAACMVGLWCRRSAHVAKMKKKNKKKLTPDQREELDTMDDNNQERAMASMGNAIKRAARQRREKLAHKVNKMDYELSY